MELRINRVRIKRSRPVQRNSKILRLWFVMAKRTNRNDEDPTQFVYGNNQIYNLYLNKYQSVERNIEGQQKLIEIERLRLKPDCFSKFPFQFI